MNKQQHMLESLIQSALIESELKREDQLTVLLRVLHELEIEKVANIVQQALTENDLTIEYVPFVTLSIGKSPTERAIHVEFDDLSAESAQRLYNKLEAIAETINEELELQGLDETIKEFEQMKQIPYTYRNMFRKKDA